MREVDRAFYRGKRVLITGGLGFIGSTLAIALAEAGAAVTLYDSLRHDHGGNFHNIAPVKDAVKVVIGDIRDAYLVEPLVAASDVVFHLAGQNDHLISQANPFEDVDVNVRGTTLLLEAVRKLAPKAVFVYTGTRGEYGKPAQVPAREDMPAEPLGVYEATSLACTHLTLIYARNHGLHAVALRLSNIYGERAQMLHHRFGVANWFVRLALENKAITVMGEGTIKRDFLHVDDCVEALVRVAATPETAGQVYNVGNDEPSTFKELAETIVAAAGSGSWQLVPFTAERAKQEPGDFWPDVSKLAAATGWRPTIGLPEGVARTVAFYKAHAREYWPA